MFDMIPGDGSPKYIAIYDLIVYSLCCLSGVASSDLGRSRQGTSLIVFRNWFTFFFPESVSSLHIGLYFN